MTVRAIRTILFLWCMFSYNGMEGKEISREKDLELERQLKLVNKPAVTTIKTIYGDIYNCVDFYQQPAFDHPLLKDHKFDFKIRPSSYSKQRRHENDSDVFDPSKLWLDGKGCPVGTVPIKNITKNDLYRAKLASQMYDSKFNPESAETPGLHFAIMRTKADPNMKYCGASMYTTLRKLQVQSSQSSYSRLKVKNDADYIEVGWMVNPLMYKDQQTRMYIYTNAGASRCFNTFCPGFVHVNSGVPLDLVLPVSNPVKELIASIKFMIDHDGKTGNWYLSVGDKNEIVGYWNNRIFKTGLNNFASYIDWGGQVYGPPSLPSAPMGNGFEVIGSDISDAFCWQVQYANQTHFLIAENIEQYVDIPQKYSVIDVGVSEGERRRQFYYGGPGGYLGN